MTTTNRFKLIIRYAFLIIPLFTPIFVNGSVVKNPPLPPKNPTAKAPQQAVGTTDSLQTAKRFLQQNKPKVALQISLDLLKKATKSNDSILIKDTNILIARIFKRTNNYEKALYYLKQGYSIALKLDSIENIALINLSISNMFYKTNQPDSATIYLNKVIELKSDKKEIEILRAQAFNNLSILLVNNSDLIQAQINTLGALEIHEKYNNSLSTANALNTLSSIYLELERYKDAKRVAYEALTLIIDKKEIRIIVDLKDNIYDNLSFALYNLKDYKSYIYQEKSFEIRDSLRNAEISGILAEIEGKYNKETIKKQEQLKTAIEKSKKEKLEKEKLKTQNINNILIIISLSLFIAAWLIYRYLKLRQTNLQLEFNQNKLIQKNKLELIQNEAREKILNATLDGKESERKMIAETLHHSVSSLLSSASLHLQASKMQLKEKPPEEILKAQLIINEAAEKIRNLSHSLVSSVLLKFGLAYAIQDLCDKYSNSTLNFHCDCVNIKRYNQDFELKINSIIDELLNNIIKHSKASNAEIKLHQKKNLLEISILDDGRGFNPDKDINRSGLGLRQIETRINKMEGIFKIDSAKDGGTSIFIAVPIKAQTNTI